MDRGESDKMTKGCMYCDSVKKYECDNAAAVLRRPKV
jgi:hypothetical protein